MEYTAKAFTPSLWKEGTRHQLTVPDTPEKNGIVKRIHTIQEKAGVMMQVAKAEAVNTAAYMKNLSP